MKTVEIFTDGGSLGNPGPGGYGVVLKFQDQRSELSEGFRKTTNNRMELMAAIAGLTALKEPCHVKLYSDSQYLVNAMEKGWAKKWQVNGWMRNKKESALNPDLWQDLLNLCEKHRVQFFWIKGHNGDPENELCDRLCRKAAQGSHLKRDHFYEAQKR